MLTIGILVLILWGAATICRKAEQRKAQRRAMEEAQHALSIQRARQAAREAQRRDQEEQLAIVRAQREQYIALVMREREERRLLLEAQKQEEEARKEAERQRKADFERAQAVSELEYLNNIRAGYCDLYDQLEKELNSAYTTEKRRSILQRQILQLEEKLHKIDQKRAKAYYLVNEKGA